MNRKHLALFAACLSCIGFAPAEDLKWVQTEYGRSAELHPPQTARTGFQLLNPSETGVAFTNRLSDAKASENQIRLNGSGVALGDVNGDGLPDIYFCGLESSNALFLNRGKWRFVRDNASPEIACSGDFSTGAVFADVDGDGDLDLLVNGIGTGTRLFLNDSAGHFREKTESGLVRRFGATTLALADIDGDGDLDLYVANYRTTTVRTTGFALLKKGDKLMVRDEDRDQLEISPEGRILEQGEPDVLYLNDGRGTFAPASWTDGRFLDEDGRPLQRAPLDWGLTAAFHDWNGDGAPDLYVCNDFHSTDKIWINDGHGKFRAIPRLALRNTSTFSMAVDFSDLNRDGWDDIFVADMLSPHHARRLMQLASTDPYRRQPGQFDDRPQFDRNTVQLNRGDGTFAEIAQYCGLPASDWTWSCILMDVDLDGYDDLLCATGHLFDTQDLDAEARIQAAGPWRRERIREKLLLFPKMQQAKTAFWNRRDLTFEPTGQAWGFDQAGVSHGMALADLDGDGDLDLVVNNLNQPAGLYRNQSGAPRVTVRLIGAPPNTFAIGARMRLIGGPVEQSQTVRSGGRYLSGDSSEKVFAAGSVTNELSLEVIWPSGKRSVLHGLKANRIYEIEERSARDADGKGVGGRRLSSVVSGQSSSVGNPSPIAHHPSPRSERQAGGAPIADPVSRFPFQSPLFQDESERLVHSHHEEPFDDFMRQPLLPRKLSQLGPGVAWFDYDGDGWEDLAVGCGASGSLAVLRNNGRGGFARVGGTALDQPIGTDLTGLVGFSPAPGVRLFVCGRSGYESGAKGPAAFIFDANRNLTDASLPPISGMTGPLALADVDGDGDLDLFVGGRCQAGNWPAPVSSALFLNEGGGFKLNAAWSRAFESVGLVSGAVFADMDGDGRDDLLLALEWGSIRLFRNTGNGFIDVTTAAGLAPYVGWWNGIATGDFDGDGRLDFVASNWGWNTSYQSAEEGRRQAEALASGTTLADSTSRFPMLYYGDLDGNGVLDLVEAEWDREWRDWMPVRSRKAMAAGLPRIQERFPTYADFNRVTLAKLVDQTNRWSGALRAPWLATAVFLNRPRKFAPVVLPPEAQFAPAFGVCVADFDGDAREDIVLSQNFFEMEPTAPRLDAGRGLLLRGDGAGGFAAVSAQVSGILVYGEGRGAAVADFDGDGRLDLAVAQNGAETKLFRGVSAKPGLRVRLQGGPGNPQAVGAVVRLHGDKEAGPAHCVQAGSGYWSQDSSTMVLGRPGGALMLSVRWPGGRVTESKVPPNAIEVVVEISGALRVSKP